jgi:cell division protein FtsB
MTRDIEVTEDGGIRWTMQGYENLIDYAKEQVKIIQLDIRAQQKKMEEYQKSIEQYKKEMNQLSNDSLVTYTEIII